MIWPNHRRVEILVKSVDPGVVKNGPLGDGDQLRWGPIFGPNGAPLAPRWALGGPHCDLAASPSKKGLWVMVTNYSGDPFFGPNGAPLSPRWALGGPHRDLAASL